jgi:SHS2 domain-containing protein
MYTYQLLPHVADVRLKLEADTLIGLFEAGLAGMNHILNEQFCRKNPPLTIRQKVTIEANDETLLLIDFLSQVLTLSYRHRTIFCQVKITRLESTLLEAELAGAPTTEFEEDIKAVTYHQADVRQREDGKWETIVIFDI